MLSELNEMAHGAITNESLTAPQLFKRLGQPGDIAPLVAFLLGDESKFATSDVYTIGGGWGA